MDFEEHIKMCSIALPWYNNRVADFNEGSFKIAATDIGYFATNKFSTSLILKKIFGLM